MEVTPLRDVVLLGLCSVKLCSLQKVQNVIELLWPVEPPQFLSRHAHKERLGLSVQCPLSDCIITVQTLPRILTITIQRIQYSYINT